ncbi:MAG TPA: helix-turn-helix domain-containing protein [Pseudomonadales bacterium]|nr:helix-turn-helix domain-containing protein [Pseudomonadales bacterium]
MEAAEVKRQIESSSVPAALTIIGDRWTLSIVRMIWQGTTRFDDLLTGLSIPRSTLSARFKHLIDAGCLQKKAYSTQPPRFDYLLTKKGEALYQTLVLAEVWNQQWCATNVQTKPVQFIHTVCGKKITPSFACRACLAPIAAAELVLQTIPSPTEAPEGVARPRRSRGESDLNAGRLLAEDILGDRWSSFIIACFFYGVKRYADIVQLIGIAPNILSSRLNLLLENQLIEKRLYQTKPERYAYRLTEKGKALFPLIVSMSQWGDHWLRAHYQPSAVWTHVPCQQLLQPVLLCPHCKQVIHATQLKLS